MASGFTAGAQVARRTLAPGDAQQKRVRRRGLRRARGARVAPSTRPRWARRERRERRKPRARHHSAARPSRRQPRQRSRSRQACRRNASGAGRAGACAVYRQRSAAASKLVSIGVMQGETSHARIVAGSSPVRFSIVRAPPDRVTSGRAPPQLVCAPPSCAGRLATCALSRACLPLRAGEASLRAEYGAA